ncbi:MAG: methionine biosynthesis protein MetW [Chloroflexi bacterium RBG_16_56_11]|nr:MAG: methionine biosynthesis protein MetW [Chloroflexi bacterium RBG_16_56_11]
MKSNTGSLEHDIIVTLVKPGASVLDLGCGDGDLMTRLVKEKNARAQGIELNEPAIYKCVAKGLSVFHGDIDSGLPEYDDASFDYVILSQSLQQVQKPDAVLKEALRVGAEVIVSFPNFAHYTARLQIALGGKTPITPSLPYEWYNTPNLHFLSISDFIGYCSKRDIRIKKSAFVGRNRRIRILPNLFALIGIFLIADGKRKAKT